MKPEELQYLSGMLHRIKDFVQLGARSEHHMERELFRKINEDLVAICRKVDEQLRPND